MSTDSNPADGLRGAVGDLAAELGSLVPRLFERSRDQLAVLAKVVEQLPCLGALANVGRTGSDTHTPDLRLVTGGAEATVEPIEVDEVPAPATPPPAKSAAATSTQAKPAVAKKGPPGKPAATRKAAATTAAKAPAAKKKATARPAAPTNAATPTLAIPDYDELAASQVIPRLDNMTPEELEAIRVHETSNRQRRTILSRVAQLQTG